MIVLRSEGIALDWVGYQCFIDIAAVSESLLEYLRASYHKLPTLWIYAVR